MYFNIIYFKKTHLCYWFDNQNQKFSLTLFGPGGGHYGPDDQRSFPVSTWIALRSPNFLTLFLLLFYKSQKSHFQKKKILLKISNVVKNIQRGTLLCINQNFQDKYFFWKTLFFLPEYELYMISAFFWGTYLICSTKFQIFVIFSMKFSILTFAVSMAITSKLHYLEDYFWCLWKGKDLNFHMKANVWLFEAIPQHYHVNTRSGP